MPEILCFFTKTVSLDRADPFTGLYRKLGGKLLQYCLKNIRSVLWEILTNNHDLIQKQAHDKMEVLFPSWRAIWKSFPVSSSSLNNVPSFLGLFHADQANADRWTDLGLDLGEVDCPQLAQAFGAGSQIIEGPALIGPVLESSIRQGKPIVRLTRSLVTRRLLESMMPNAPPLL